jgi:glutathione synthase/RimK-type ligase-like ATP-grasp enzyme
MDYFVLNYGAIDIIVTPEGRHVFLEVNPVGEFFWLERHPGLPIADAIADVLLGRAPRRLAAAASSFTQ